MKKATLILLFVNCFIFNSHSQCTDNIFINGSFSGMKGEGNVASGWVGASSPDINDENGTLNTTPGYSWSGIPLASNDGGTWQNIFGVESFQQTVSAIVGQSYNLCFEYAAQGIAISGINQYVNPVGVNIYINGVLTFTAPDDNTQYTWENICFSFIANSPSLAIKFVPTQTQYLGIDGACLQNDTHTPTMEIINATSDFTIFPNPFIDNVNIVSNGTEQLEIIIYDVSSRKLIQKTFTNAATLSTENLKKGIYYYTIKGDNGSIKRGKLIKE